MRSEDQPLSRKARHRICSIIPHGTISTWSKYSPSYRPSHVSCYRDHPVNPEDVYLWYGNEYSIHRIFLYSESPHTESGNTQQCVSLDRTFFYIDPVFRKNILYPRRVEGIRDILRRYIDLLETDSLHERLCHLSDGRCLRIFPRIFPAHSGCEPR